MFQIKTFAVSAFAILLAIYGDPARSDVPYLEYDIPAMEGARNIQQDVSTEFSTITVSYSLEFQDDLEILRFYNSYFSEKRWERLRMKLMQEYPDQFEGESADEWDGWSIGQTEGGAPRANYAANWQNQFINSAANVALEVNAYESRRFHGKITVTIAPNVQPLGIMDLNELFRSNPESVFILHKELGHSPFRFDLVDLEHLEELSSEGEMFETYYGIVSAILEQYRSWAPYGG